MRASNWVRVFAQRLTKQNLLYQLRLGSVTKQDMGATAVAMDRLLDRLTNGGTEHWVPKPPTRQIRAQVERVDAKWGPLRVLAMASPFDIVRRSGISSRSGDPLMLRHFSNLAAELGEAAEQLLALYLEQCLEAAYPLCRDQAINGLPQLLSERMVTELALIQSGMDAEANTAKLRANRDTYAAIVQRIGSVSIVQEAMDPSRGTPARAISEILQSAELEWAELRAEIDRVLANDEPVRIDFARILNGQARMEVNMTRLNLAMRYFAASQQGLRPPTVMRP